MRAAILTIGDELICGYRLDTNTQTIARWVTVEATLSKEGVEPLAVEVRRMAGADVGLAAGAILCPQDGLSGRPYGVLVAAVDLGGDVTRRRFSYSGERSRVRDLAADAVLNLLRLRLLGRWSRRQPHPVDTRPGRAPECRRGGPPRKRGPGQRPRRWASRRRLG
ncbi:MAG TPA: hypothetical protein EYH30_01985 [Anaerolineales bacterium]|nr:hypothetical protein [Anaerolineae bacterium]HIQ00892.1 hypothetical protein [Anaerolineales bacterium]